MDKVATITCQTPDLLKAARNAFRDLAINQENLERALRSKGDYKNSLVAKRNLRLLMAFSGQMERFMLLSVPDQEALAKTRAEEIKKLQPKPSKPPPEEEAQDVFGQHKSKAKPTSQLVKDIRSSQARPVKPTFELPGDDGAGEGVTLNV